MSFRKMAEELGVEPTNAVMELCNRVWMATRSETLKRVSTIARDVEQFYVDRSDYEMPHIKRLSEKQKDDYEAGRDFDRKLWNEIITRVVLRVVAQQQEGAVSHFRKRVDDWARKGDSYHTQHWQLKAGNCVVIVRDHGGYFEQVGNTQENQVVLDKVVPYKCSEVADRMGVDKKAMDKFFFGERTDFHKGLDAASAE